MSIDELIQLMRTCSLAQVRQALERIKRQSKLAHEDSIEYQTIVTFYQLVAAQK